MSTVEDKFGLYHVDAFVHGTEGGNPAGVMVLMEDMDGSEMQEIAKRVGYSETAFVRRLDDETFKVRFFTPVCEIDLCGHATIGLFGTLLQLGLVEEGLYTQQTRAGNLAVKIMPPVVVMEQSLPSYRENVPFEELKGCFKMGDGEVDYRPVSGFKSPFIGSTGVWDLFVPVKDEKTLMALVPNDEKIADLSRTLDVCGIHAFTESEVNGFDYVVRNFAPLYGIPEESATGTSNGLLACASIEIAKKGKTRYGMLQGVGMGLPSDIRAELEVNGDRVTKVWVGGTTGTIRPLTID